MEEDSKHFASSKTAWKDAHEGCEATQENGDAHLTKRALHTFCAVNEARLRQPVGGGHCFVGRLNTKAVHDVLRVEKKGCEKGKFK